MNCLKTSVVKFVTTPPTTLDAPLRETQSTATSGGSSMPTSGVSTPTLGVNMATVNSDVLVEG